MSFGKEIAQEMQDKLNKQKAKQKRIKRIRIIKYLLLYFLIFTLCGIIIFLAVEFDKAYKFDKQIQEQDFFMVVYYPYKGSLEEFYKEQSDIIPKLLEENEISYTKIIAFKADSNYLTIYVYNK